MAAHADADELRIRLADAGSACLALVEALARAHRALGPGSFDAVRDALRPARDALASALGPLRASAAPAGLEGLRDDLARAGAVAVAAADGLLAPPRGDALAGALASLRGHAAALEALYPLRAVLPPLGRLFAEPAWWGRLAELDPPPRGDAPVGVLRGRGERPDGRGGFALYVPERYDPARRWPLLVALHGGFGDGASFLWTWLREARSRGCLLLAPTSPGSTWSLTAPGADAERLRRMVAYVSERWRVDPARVLLTGLSDGATFTLLAGLAEGAPYTALAPGAGVLHPLNFALGNLERAAGRRIWLIHGARDWMFPIGLARAARDALREAGAALHWREIADLGHGWPREENARILRWLDPELALPGEAPEPDA